MRIITWNCQGAFRKKFKRIAAFKPDLAVIQECEHPERLRWKDGPAPACAAWFGEKPSKGVGVFSWTNLSFGALEGYDAGIRYCIPLQIEAPYRFRAVAVWAMDHPMGSLSYSAQIYQAVAAYRGFIQAEDTLFLGDFNSSKRTTPRGRIGNHASLTIALEDLWLTSAYHHFFHEKQGQERHGTYFRGRKTDKPGHIDYIYLPTRWLRRLARVQLGDPAVWLADSDHCPVIVDIDAKDETNIV
jgi:endonuclease/exonuclease/phosphatase family metal-dependent hydrolase